MWKMWHKHTAQRTLIYRVRAEPRRLSRSLVQPQRGTCALGNLKLSPLFVCLWMWVGEFTNVESANNEDLLISISCSLNGSAPAYQGREQTPGWKWYLGNSSCHDGCDRRLRPVCPWLIGTFHFFTCGFVLHVGGEKRSKKQTKKEFFFKLLRLKEYYFGQTSVTERFHLRGLCWLQVWTVPPMRLWKQKWDWEIQPPDLHILSPFNGVKMLSHFCNKGPINGAIMWKKAWVLFVVALPDRLYRNPMNHFCFCLFIYSFIIFNLEKKKPHHLDKCSHRDFNKHQELYGCSKVNSPFRAITWVRFLLNFFSPVWFCWTSAEMFKKELVYHHARHKCHSYEALPTPGTLQMTTVAELQRHSLNRGGSVPLGGRQGAIWLPFLLVYTEVSVPVIM